VAKLLIFSVRLNLAILMGGASLASAAIFAPPASNRLQIDFNAGWLYVQGDIANAQLQGFNDSVWTSVGLPHTTKFVSSENPSAYLGVSWYRKHFVVTNAYQGLKIFIEFGAAMQRADVWINGTQIVFPGPNSPHHVGGYLPFTVDATTLLNYGGADNVIAVRLDSTPNSNWAPGNSNPDFQYHGGLYRDVNLIIADKLHVTDAIYVGKVAGGGIFVTYPSVTSGSATVNVLTDVLNENSAAQNATLISTLTDANSNIVQTVTNTISIPGGTDTSLNQNLIVASPNLWGPNNPYLYTLHTVVQEGTTVVDYQETQIGIRSIQWTHNNAILINGVPFKAMGANFHQDIYGEGNARPDRTTYYDVKRFKDAGFDFVRGCHYPHDPSFYNACDQLGVLVMDSQPGWQYYNGATPFNLFDTNTFQDCRDMIRRDRNHPSVILWETSLNESSYTTSWATNEQAIAHAEYPGNQMFTSGWITTSFDTLCSSEQAGVRSTSDTRPIIIDEYGDWDYGGNSSTSRVAREDIDSNLLAQCDNFELSLNEDLDVSWFSADALWDFADYTGYLSTTTKCGVMDFYRLPKFSYYFYQSQRDASAIVTNANVQTGPMIYIANTMQANSPAQIRVFSNCQHVSLYTNGVLFATQTPDTTYSDLSHPPFTFNVPNNITGTIRADGITNGSVACSFTRRTPGTPVQVLLQAEGMDSLLADGGDARLIFVSVVDANGQVVPSATNTVNLSISGHGTILGPTNIVMKGGELATWLQAGRVAGIATLTASGSGLIPASLTLTNQPVPYIDSIDPLPVPVVPTGLGAWLGSNSVALAWNPAAFAFTYNVKSSANFGGPYTLVAPNISTTNFIAAYNGTTTYYVVSAVNEAGEESSNSAPVTPVVPLVTASLVNPGFETNTSGTVFNTKVSTGYDVSGNNVAGWLNAGTTYNDSGVDYAGDNGVVVHSGNVAAYCDQGDSGVYQIVNYQLQAGDQVTLTWWAKSSWQNADQNVKLLSAASFNSAYASLTQLTNSTAALNNTGNGGIYTQYTLNYIATASDVAKYPAVSFYSPGTPGSWATFDDFNLTILSIPPAPSGLDAVAGNGQAVLTWNAVANATGYYVKQSLVSTGSFTSIATNLVNVTFTNTGLANGTNYYYVVSAFNQAGQGPNSLVISAEPLPPLPAIPTGLLAVATNGQINLTWYASAGATGYNIYRSLIPGGFDTSLASDIAATNYADTTAVPGVTYYYSLTATNLAGQSDFSGQASATEPIAAPVFVSVSISGTNLVLNGTNGAAGMNYLVLVSTNLILPLTNWTVLATNVFDLGGGFNFTNSLNLANPQQFYRIMLP
jgi:fibronectin type 3 domain-containing protein